MLIFFKKIKNLDNELKFLFLMLVLYLIIFFVDFNYFFKIWQSFKFLSLKIFPALLGVFILIFFFNLFLTNKKIKQYLAGKADWKKFFLCAGLGVLSSGPIYAWYPFLAELKKSGFKNSLVAIFLYNRAIKLPLISVLLSYFCLKFVFLLFFLMLFFSFLNALLVGLMFNKN